MLGDSISHFYAADEERHRDASNPIQDHNISPSRSIDRYQEAAVRARSVIERPRNLGMAFMFNFSLLFTNIASSPSLRGFFFVFQRTGN